MGIFQDAASIAKALALQIAAGCPMASDKEQAERHKICKGCEFLNKEEYRCGKCKCFLKLKIPLGTSECPIGLWKKSTGDNNDN